MADKQLNIFSIGLFIFVLMVNQSVFGTSPIDSLQHLASRAKGTELISVQQKLAVELANSKWDEAEDMAQKALVKAKKFRNKALIETGYFSLGRIYEIGEDINQAIAFYDSAMVVSDLTGNNWLKADIILRQGIIHQSKGEEAMALESLQNVLRYGRLSNNLKTLGTAYSIMGNIYRINGLYDRAIEYIIKAKLNYEKADYSEGAGWASYLLGLIYVDLGLPDKAQEHFDDALSVYRKLAEIDGHQNGIAICYEQIGLLKMNAGHYSEALAYIRYSLNTFTENGSQYGMSNAYKNLGKIEYAKGEFGLAEQHLAQSLSIKQHTGDLMGQPPVYEYLGLCYIGMGQTEKGLLFLNKALEMATTNKQKRLQTDIYAKLTKTYLASNNLPKAIASQGKQIEIQDSLLSGAVKIKMEQLQSIYEIDEKNSEIAELEKQNEINFLRLRQHQTSQIILISVIFLALLIAGIIYFFYRKLRHKNQQLNEAVATKDKFFSIVAHDLRGPIGSSLTLSEFLLEEIEQKNYKTVEQYASVFHQTLGDSFTLLNNLLDWSRSQLQRIEFNPQFLSLPPIIQEIEALHASPINKKQIHLSKTFETDLLVFADESMLKTILRNLISNAIKYSHQKGEIEFAAYHDEQSVVLSVSDNGLGMSAQKADKLFSFQMQTSTPGTSGEQGTGLGLILVKEFVAKHNGTIRVESTPGKGSRFIISLPKA